LVFSANTIEEVSRILAEHTTGTKITNMLQNLNLYDVQLNDYPSITKWIRLQNAISDSQNKTGNGNALIKVIEWIMDPVRFLNTNENEYRSCCNTINALISFDGIELNNRGKIVVTKKATNFSEAYQKATTLKKDLEPFNIHKQILAFCRPEIIAENYFHLIFEASKCLLSELRFISGLQIDGNNLINQCFDGNNPLIIMNRLSTEDEKSEHKGLQSLLNTVVYLYRNPKAHNPKFFSIDSKEDTIAAILMISKARYMLDSCSRNPLRSEKFS